MLQTPPKNNGSSSARLTRNQVDYLRYGTQLDRGGNAYIDREYPLLDHIIRVVVLR